MDVALAHHDVDVALDLDLTLADVDATCSQGDEPVDLRLAIAVDGWGEVEVQPVLSWLRLYRRTAPRDLRTAVG
jgi:hypothetical protein